MKKILISSTIILSLLLCAGTSNAQVSVSVNIGVQPDWGPVGYDYVEYYYIPAYEVYYYVPNRQFIYFDNGHWIFATVLPARFGAVNLYTPYKVVINEPKPYLHFKEHQIKYASYKTAKTQVVIRDSKDPKYKEAREKSNQDNQKAKPDASYEKATPKKDQPNSTPAHDSKEKQKPKEKKPDEKGPKTE